MRYQAAMKLDNSRNVELSLIKNTEQVPFA